MVNHPPRYWDWSLDWENVTQAPVWDNILGFGGDGDEKDLESVHGHCVTDGPFARLQVLYVEKFPYPHCLSRGFARGDNLTRFSAALEPRALDELLRTPDYATFNLGVEDGPHLSIPRSVHGDFSTVTAPAGLSHSHGLISVSTDLIQIQCSFSITHNLIGCGGSGSRLIHRPDWRIIPAKLLIQPSLMQD